MDTTDILQSLLKAAEHCRELLQNNPEDIELRIALTNVYGCLGTRYLDVLAKATSCRNDLKRIADNSSLAELCRPSLEAVKAQLEQQFQGRQDSAGPRRVLPAISGCGKRPVNEQISTGS